MYTREVPGAKRHPQRWKTKASKSCEFTVPDLKSTQFNDTATITAYSQHLFLTVGVNNLNKNISYWNVEALRKLKTLSLFLKSIWLTNGSFNLAHNLIIGDCSSWFVVSNNLWFFIDFLKRHYVSQTLAPYPVDVQNQPPSTHIEKMHPLIMPGSEDKVPTSRLPPSSLYHLPSLFECHSDGNTHPGQTSLSLPGGKTLNTAAH